MTLNAAQKEAVECSSGALLILAGPGTGKTRVIISKIEHLLQQGIKPEEILALTFSRRATQEMIDRLPEASAELIEVSTLHAFCVEIVQKHGFRLGLKRKVEMMSQAQSQLFFRQVVDRLPIQSFVQSSNFDPIISALLQFFSECKDEGLWPEDLIRYATRLSEETTDEKTIRDEWMSLGDVYNAYQSFCLEKGYCDFGDSILFALRLLQDHPMVRQEIQKRYKVILVDEFQDTNWSQVELLRLLGTPQTHIAVVGDDDQAIYRFRGASYSAFQFFKNAFPQLKTIELNETYRLSPEITEVSSTLIRANGDQRYSPNKKVKSLARLQGAVEVLKFGSHEDEAREICKQIEKLLSEGVAPKEIGILVRAHSHAVPILEAARDRLLPIEATSSESLFEHEIVCDLMAFFSLLRDPRDSISLLRLMDSPLLLLSSDEIYQFCEWGKFRNSSYLDRLSKLSESPLNAEVQSKLLNFHTFFKEMFAQASRLSCSDIIVKICETFQMVPYLLKTAPDSLRTLGRFHSQLHEWEALQPRKDFRSTLSLLEELAQNEASLSEQEDSEKSPDKISILTVHASKGLEFEYVFCPSLVGRRFPQNFRSSTWSIPDQIRKEAAPTKATHTLEERRLFYVAMTRAKKRLILSTVEKKGVKPSIFLTNDLKDLSAELLKWRTFEGNPNEGLKKLEAKPFERMRKTDKSAFDANPTRENALSLSFTQLDKYETCPLAYRFKYDFRIPTPASASLSVGSAVHSALESFFRLIQQARNPTKEDLLRLFEENFNKELEQFPDLSDRDRQLGLTKLAAYFEFHRGQFPVPLALEKDFTLCVGPHKIRGKIDRVDQEKDGVRIIDYKTGKAKSIEDSADRKFAEDSLQLSIYALAATEVFNWKLKELVLYYIYENSALISTRTPQSLEETKVRILNIASQIQAKSFEARPGFQCQWCEFKKICPSAKS